MGIRQVVTVSFIIYFAGCFANVFLIIYSPRLWNKSSFARNSFLAFLSWFLWILVLFKWV